MRADEALMIGKVTTAASTAVVAGVAADTIVTDLMICFLGAFASMSARDTLGGKVHEFAIGMAVGLAVALICREAGVQGWRVMSAEFCAAMLSTQFVAWIRRPEDGAKAIGAIIKAARSFFAFLGGAGK